MSLFTQCARSVCSPLLAGFDTSSTSRSSVYRTDLALALDASTGAPPSHGGAAAWGHRNPANRVVAILWHQARFGIRLFTQTHPCRRQLISHACARRGIF